VSFGDPNNPYGQQPQQGGQPGYGYPQQSPQGGQQPGYGYPAAPPVSPYGDGGYPGYPGLPVEMPGTVKAARVLLWILGVLQIVGGIGVAALGGTFASEFSSELENSPEGTGAAITGVLVVVGVIGIAFGVWGILTAVKTASGRNGVRVGGIVYASLVSVGCLISLLGANFFALLGLAMSVLVIVFFAKADGAAWFQRPRH
jgi:hypothetical protein